MSLFEALLNVVLRKYDMPIDNTFLALLNAALRKYDMPIDDTFFRIFNSGNNSTVIRAGLQINIVQFLNLSSMRFKM